MACTKTALICVDKIVDLSLPDDGEIESEISTGDIPGAMRSILCYIAGSCIHAVKQSIKDTINSRLSQPQKKNEILRDQIRCNLIKRFEIQEADLLASTSGQESLQEIADKQGLRRGLTNVTDTTNVFFIQLFRLHQRTFQQECLRV